MDVESEEHDADVGVYVRRDVRPEGGEDTFEQADGDESLTSCAEQLVSRAGEREAHVADDLLRVVEDLRKILEALGPQNIVHGGRINSRLTDVDQATSSGCVLPGLD